MLPSSDDVELLVGGPRALDERHGDQVLTEVAGRGVDEQAPSVGSLDADALKGPRRRVVPLVRLGGRRGVELVAGARDGDRLCRVGDSDDRAALAAVVDVVGRAGGDRSRYFGRG